MKKILPIILMFTLTFLAACAPQLARPLIVYAATTEQVTNTIVSTATRTKPEGSYSNWTVTGIGETSVALRSDADFLGRLGHNPITVTMVWTFRKGPGGVAVAVDSSGFDDPRKTEQVFFDALDTDFRRM
jgi:hypothetical protein